MLLMGGTFHISWMVMIATGYLAFLWLPCTPEKIVTVSIAVFMLKKFFPEDEKTLSILEKYFKKVKNAFKVWKDRIKR